jgi:molecular chaperone DnaK
MDRMTIDVGIDLGTTNSTIAVIDGLDAKVIPNKVGSGTTPSAVWLDPRGNLRVGHEAKARTNSDTGNAYAEFKQAMGRGEEARRTFARDGRTMLPEELSAEVLKTLKLDFQANTGEDLHTAVITVPAAFESPATAATRRAAEAAGLTKAPLLLEPYAASLAYGFQTKSENVYWLVYDFGGGTFDAAVMRIRDGLIQAVNHNGHNDLGGKKIDWDIVEQRLVPALQQEYDLPDFQRGTPRWAEAIGWLKFAAENAKVDVCRTRAAVEIYSDVPICVDASGKEVNVSYRLSPEDVEAVSGPYIEASLRLCRATLEQAQLAGPDMERILMVGGTTLSPWVREAVESELGGTVEFGIDPVTVVARGAAIYAATQPIPGRRVRPVAAGTWTIDIIHQPVGNVPDPDIGGTVVGPDGRSPEGYTLEFVDLKSGWSTGRLTLGANGVFMTHLHAEVEQRHEFSVELSDPTGSRVPTSPETLPYTIGVIPEPNPPAANSIGIGLKGGGVAWYVRKGERLPMRRLIDHYSAVALRSGREEDVLRIPLIEGESERAERNYHVGEVTIRGSDLHRDLMMGDPLDITLRMDTSGTITIEVYLRHQEQDLPTATFQPRSGHASLEELRQDIQRERDRLAKIRKEAQRTGDVDAEAAIARIVDEQLGEHLEKLLARAGTDPDVDVELDRRVREFASVIDLAEDALEWPAVVDAAREALGDTQKVVHAYGDLDDRNCLADLTAGLDQAVQVKDPQLIRRQTEELDSLYFRVLDRQIGFHIGRLDRLEERVDEMRDPAQARRLVAQGRQAIKSGDTDALKATLRQLLSLLPEDARTEARTRNEGDTGVNLSA